MVCARSAHCGYWASTPSLCDTGRLPMLKFTLAAALLLVAGQAQAQSATDRAALDALPSKFSEAWATHDGSKLAELVADNIDWITVGGTWYRGKRDFELYHTRL